MEKCKKRGLRRDLTSSYQDRQTMLRANYYGWEAAREQRKYYRKQNAINCGRPGCLYCINERYNPWNSNALKLTMPERKNEDSVEDQFKEYYTTDLNI